MSPNHEPKGAMTTPHAESSAWPEEGKAASRLLDSERCEQRAFAQQEAALQRMGAQLRAANAKIEGIKQRLQAPISPRRR